jgi:hypothetical protein
VHRDIDRPEFGLGGPHGAGDILVAGTMVRDAASPGGGLIAERAAEAVQNHDAVSELAQDIGRMRRTGNEPPRHRHPS